MNRLFTRRRVYMLLLAVPLFGFLGFWSYYHYEFPFGWSHCCIKNMMFSLEGYARDHGGAYPAGEATSEGSLSLLYGAGLTDPYTLRGKSVPESVAKAVLESGRLLGPDTCGWHYTPGLTESDNPKFGLLWSKEPLDHNGGRTDGGREVVFVGGNVEWVSGEKWDQFLRNQDQLLRKRPKPKPYRAPLVAFSLRLPDGRQVDELDEPFELYKWVIDESGTGSERSRFSWFSSNAWTIYRPPQASGSITYQVESKSWISEPLTIHFTNGVPSLTNAVFRLRSR